MKRNWTMGLVAAAAVAAASCSACRGAHASDVYEAEAWTADSLQHAMTPAATKSQIVEYPGFIVSFNSEYRLPNWVAWELTRDECRSSDAHRKNSAFMPDERVEGCPSLDDYRRSGFDRGHMCPAGDMKWSKEAMDACFLLTNICPQDKNLNGGSWQTLEDKCRQWAERDSAIVIVCGPILTDRLTRKIGDNVAVPERFFKVVLAPYAKPMRGIGFIMPNGPVPGGMNATAVSIDEIEAATGIDFFACLPDDIEDAVEAACDLPQWNRRR